MAASIETDEDGYPRLLRARDGTERELSTWIQQPHPEDQLPLSVCPGSLQQPGICVESKNLVSSPEQIYLFSLSSGPEWVHLDFLNNTSEDVTLIWLNFCGAEVAYGLIRPAQHFDIWSFKSHPWIARQGTNADGARLMVGESMVIFPEIPRVNIPITQPPHLTWSLQTHKHFPGSFRDRTKQLLLAYHRLVKDATGSHACSSRITRSKSVCLERSLDAVPIDVLLHIISFMAPPQRQCITLLPDGHPNIPPASLPYDPSTRTGTCVGCGGSHTGA